MPNFDSAKVPQVTKTPRLPKQTGGAQTVPVSTESHLTLTEGTLNEPSGFAHSYLTGISRSWRPHSWKLHYWFPTSFAAVDISACVTRVTVSLLALQGPEGHFC